MDQTNGGARVVQAIYEAFGRGDLPAILNHVTDDTAWGFNGARREVAWHAPVQGKSELPHFFQALGESTAMEHFEPKQFIVQGDDVIVHIRVAYTVKKTGRRVDEEQLHWWTLRGGKVARMVHFEDTAQVAAALA